MYDEPTFFAVLLFAAAGASAVASVGLWSRRRITGVLPLWVAFLGSFIWSLTYALYWLAESPAARIFWLDATYIGVVIAPTAFLVFVVGYTNRSGWLTRYTLALLTVEPLLTLLLLWTDSRHGIFFAGQRTPASSTIFDGGPWFWIHIIYTYGLLLFSYVLLVQHYRQMRGAYRQQTRLILLGFTLPWIGNVLSLTGLTPWPALDLTPVLFTLTGLILVHALFYQQLFDIVPVARGEVMETMREPVFVVDARQRIVDINPAGERLLRRMAPAASAPFVGAPMERYFPGWMEWRTTSDTALDITLEIEGHTEHYERRRSPIVDTQGNRQGHVVVLNNVTQRRLAVQRALEYRLERERHHLLTTFLQDVSHEFRTPLTVISSNAYLLNRIEDPAARAEKVAQIEQQVQRITRLVDTLTLMARLENQEELLSRPVSLNEVIATTCAALADRAAGGPAIRVVTNPDVPPVLGDPAYLVEAVRQLVDNALRFTPPGGVITVSSGVEAARAWVAVHDTGPGIPEEDQARIFETFWRKDEAHSTPGLGVGLSIARKIAQAYGGDIGVESSPETGTTFRITLPAAGSIQPAAGSAQPAAGSAQPAAGSIQPAG